MSDFFRRYFHGIETPPYEEAFAQVGLRFIRAPRAPVTIGIAPDDSEATNFKIASVRAGSPAADANLQIGDVITSFGGNKFTPVNYLKVLARYKAGDRVQLSATRAGRPFMTLVTLAPPQLFDYRIEPGAATSTEAKGLRAAWLSGRS